MSDAWDGIQRKHGITLEVLCSGTISQVVDSPFPMTVQFPRPG